MPNELRKILSMPQGTLLIKSNGLIKDLTCDATIGDIVSKTINSKIKVIDGYTLRSRVDTIQHHDIINPRSTISLHAYTILTNVSHGKIAVYGEEDLLVLPIVMNKNVKSCVYGQPGVGVVYITVNSYVRKRFREILKTFKLDFYDKAEYMVLSG